ncbi:MAG: hypothetical protein JJ878_12830 [Alphaproteobacteria bacterium]|nr:hypothetical protein [Alphaproteobacteria bacterium]MBO6863517.1 hypothetical protein [Alphaproteobacteria bacterium]
MSLDVQSRKPAKTTREDGFHTVPFPYRFVLDFLPTEIYQGIEANWPDIDTFDREGGGYNKIRYRMGRDRVEQELAQTCPSWAALHRHLTQTVFPALEEVAKPIVRHRTQGRDVPIDWDYILTTDLPGNHFGIHVDPPQRIFSGLIYIGTPESKNLPGTTVYRARKSSIPPMDPLKVLGLGHYNLPQEKEALFEDFEVLDFQPNSAFLFANCDRAWHGVEHHGTGARRLIHIVYRIDLAPFVGVDNGTLNATPDAASDEGIAELRRQLDYRKILDAFTDAGSEG